MGFKSAQCNGLENCRLGTSRSWSKLKTPKRRRREKINPLHPSGVASIKQRVMSRRKRTICGHTSNEATREGSAEGSVAFRWHSDRIVNYFVFLIYPSRINASINPLAAIPAKTNECQGSAVFRQRNRKAAKLPLPLPWPTCGALDIHLAEQRTAGGVNAGCVRDLQFR